MAGGERLDSTNNLYLDTARWYDMDTASYSERDLAFYLDMARRCNGRILELACGTGRITLPLVNAGFEVWALDLSRPMLDQLRRKADQLPPDVRKRLHIVEGDMCAFDLGFAFDCILIPFRGFQALIDDSQVASCLRCVRNNLSSNGRFVVNTFHVVPKDRVSAYSAEQTDWERYDTDSGERVRRARRIVAVDRERQVMYPEVIYYVTDASGRVERHSDRLALRYYFEYQLQILLVCAGFRIDSRYCDFSRSTAKSGSEFIFVCRHSVGLPALG